MARSSIDNDAVSESLAPAGGLQHFRTVAGGKYQRDDPFGVPPDRKARSLPDIPVPVPTVRAPNTPKVQRDRPKNPNPTPQDEPPADDLGEGRGKGRVFPENVTVPLSVALRDRSEELARTLNRNRKIRKERITRNSVIRVALEQFLDTFTPRSDQAIESEADLLVAARSKNRKPA